eukprot:TRINITY_DN450_c0_g1_i1.p1 TRINITY_DN450_c0_g1~~TRINITY_DN450_c0_g1_i1.p1  ORF type:complete len:610 (-),score=131.52 TRINITY_DN450_c0_g1_i1:1361-3190(-)
MAVLVVCVCRLFFVRPNTDVNWRHARLVAIAAALGAQFILFVVPPLFYALKDSIVIKVGPGQNFILSSPKVRHVLDEVLGWGFTGISLTYLSNLFVFLTWGMPAGVYMATVFFIAKDLPEDWPSLAQRSSVLRRARFVICLTHVVGPIACTLPVIILYQSFGVDLLWILSWALGWSLPALFYMHLRWVIRQSIRAGYVPESKAERSKRMQSAGFGQDEYASNLTVGDGYTHIRSGPLGSIDSDLESDDEEEYEFGELLSKRSKLLRKIRNHAWANGVLYFEVYCIATGIILHGEHRHDVDVSFLITLLVTIFISILVLTNFTLEHARKRLESGPVRMTMRVPAASKSLSSGGDDAMYQALGDEFESDEVPGNEDPEAAVVDSMKEEDVAGSDSLAHVPGYGKGAGSSSLGDSVMTAPLLDDKVTISTRKRRGSDSSESSVSSSTSSSTASTAYSITAPITSHRQAKMKRRMKDIDDEMEKVERARFGYVFIRMWHFLSEKHEREDPKTYGERVHFRRIFLIVGLVFYGWLTFNELHIVQTTKVKDQVKKLLAKSGVGLTWPDNGHGGTIFDDAFALVSEGRRRREGGEIEDGVLTCRCSMVKHVKLQRF